MVHASTQFQLEASSILMGSYLDWASDDPMSPFKACLMNCTSSFAIVSCSNCLSKSAVSLSRSVGLRAGRVSAPQSTPRCLA